MRSDTNQHLPELMNRLYRYERYIFDLTRPFYLVGRDQMLKEIKLSPNQSVLEIGVGTARNLIKLHKREPRARYFGVDISTAMTEYAEKKIRSRNLPIRIHALSDQPEDYLSCFGSNQDGLCQTFDHIILSFCLTMIPDPKPVLLAALRSLNKNGGILHIADYYDQKGLPNGIKTILNRMMARYYVRFNPEPLEILSKENGKLEITPVFFRTGYRAHFALGGEK